MNTQGLLRRGPTVETATPTGIDPVLQVHPTRRCNLACQHCYTRSGPKVREELDLGLLLASVEDAVRLGYRQLSVSGGEPLLYRELRNLLSHAKGLGMVTTVTTNGMLATDERWAALAPLLDVTAISIDGRPNEHDEMRQRKGAFGRTVENLAVIRASGAAFGLIFTLTQYNVDSLEFVVRLAAEQGARSVQVHPLTLHGRAAEVLPDSRPDWVELAAALIEARQLGAALGVVVHVDAVTVDQLASYPASFVPARPVAELKAIAPVLVLQSDGWVMPLTHELDIGHRLGTLSDARLKDLAESWLEAGRGDRLAAVCERTYAELLHEAAEGAFYWYDEVAARSGPRSLL